MRGLLAIAFLAARCLAGDHGPPLAESHWQDDFSNEPSNPPDEPDAAVDPCLRPDRDRDGHLALACGGDDCDDGDAYVHPGAVDPEPAAWETEVVDPRGSTGFATSLVASPDGALHAAYIGDVDLRYATNETGTWRAETVALRVGLVSYAGPAIDFVEGPHLAFWDASMGVVSYATRAQDGTWGIEWIDPTDSTYCALAVSPEGAAHVSYRAGGDTAYATNASGWWSPSGFEGYLDSGPSSAIALDGAGNVHVVYADGTRERLMHALLDATGWSVEIVDYERDAFPSMAIDAADRVHIAFKDPQSVRYAVGGPGAWNVEVVGSFGIAAVGQVALAVAVDGSAHIAFQGGEQGDLRYATNVSGAWEVEVVASGDPPEGAFPSVAIAMREIHIFSYQAANGEMRHTHRPLTSVHFDCP